MKYFENFSIAKDEATLRSGRHKSFTWGQRLHEEITRIEIQSLSEEIGSSKPSFKLALQSGMKFWVK